MESVERKWPGRVITWTRSSSHLGLCALVVGASAPLWWLPGGFSRFVVAKLLVTAVAVLLAAAARPVGALPRPVVLAAALWAACFAVAALVGDTPLASLLGRWPRYEGLPTLGLYAAACWTGAHVVERDAAGTRRLEVVVALLALTLGAFSVLDVLGVTPLGPSTEARTGSVLGNATDQGAVAMMAALLLAGPTLRHRRASDAGGVPAENGRAGWEGQAGRVLRLVALGSAVATVAMSGSRTALGLTLAGLLALVLPHLPTDRGANVAGSVVRGLGAVAVLVAVALLVPTTRERLLDLGTADGRLHQWRLTLNLVLDHPWLGLGGSRYVDAFLAYEDATFVDFAGPRQLADSPHSVILQVLVGGGVLLLAATLLFVYVVMRQAVAALAEHPAVRPAALAVLAYVALACVNFTTAGPTCLAALLLGTVIAVPVGSDDRPGHRLGHRTRTRPRVAAAVGSGLLVAVLIAAALGDVRLQQGVEAADARATGSADALFLQTIRWRPWDVDVPVFAARILAESAALGEPGAAVRAERRAREALARLPESYEALVALGVSLSAQGRVEEAARVLDLAVTLAPERPDGYVQRAIARVGLGQLDAALVDLRRARQILPASPVVRRLLLQVGDGPRG